METNLYRLPGGSARISSGSDFFGCESVAGCAGEFAGFTGWQRFLALRQKRNLRVDHGLERRRETPGPRSQSLSPASAGQTAIFFLDDALTGRNELWFRRPGVASPFLK